MLDGFGEFSTLVALVGRSQPSQGRRLLGHSLACNRSEQPEGNGQAQE